MFTLSKNFDDLSAIDNGNEHHFAFVEAREAVREWERIFKDPMTTMAAIDRVVHHSVVLDLMDVESYRANVAATKQAGSDKTAEPA
ncbi:ATP-binding protein [Pandoraea sputorum]|uniref:ATP-binding protein n=1 Tax=Pandoraea sputorum TaxID=93222 RepID=UPI00125C8346|nr:ATP-binding protein [Pandoraea sputorum]VVE55357.1 transposase [Pandoraea sputorum]